MIAAYYLVAGWFAFMTGAFVHHLVTPTENYIIPAYYDVGPNCEEKQK